MVITDESMRKKMERALAISGNLFDMGDIDEYLRGGRMQGHVEGNTWALTQVHDWPKRRVVNILYVAGFIGDTHALEAKIEEWAKEIGADMITAVGRDGWWECRTPGWQKVGTLYSKGIHNGRR